MNRTLRATGSRSGSFEFSFMTKKSITPVLIVIIYLVTRLYNLTLLPIFFDEANYIFWAKQIAETNQHWFISLSAGKPVPFIWSIVFFLKLLPKEDYLLAGRLPSVFFGLITLFGTYKLGNYIFGKRIGLAAGLLYVISPFALFHDRMGLYDSMLSAMIIWTTYYIFRKQAVMWGVFLGGALLTKASALSLEILGPMAYLILGNFKKIRLIFIALIVSQIVANMHIVSKGYFEYISKSLDYTPGAKSFETINQIFIPNLFLSWDWLSNFITPPIFILSFAATAFMFWKKTRVALAFIVLGIIPIIGFSFLGRIYFPRYLLFTLPFFLISTSYLLDALIRKNRLLVFLTLPLLIILAIKFDFFLLTDPSKAPFSEIDRIQYVSGQPSGYGLSAIYDRLDREINHRDITLVIESDYYGHLLSATNLKYFHNKNIHIIRRWPNVIDDSLILQANKIGPVFYLTETEVKLSFQTVKIAQGKKPGNVSGVYLFRIII